MSMKLLIQAHVFVGIADSNAGLAHPPFPPCSDQLLDERYMGHIYDYPSGAGYRSCADSNRVWLDVVLGPCAAQ